MELSRKLTRNPLGIIGLFVSMIYGFSCLVLSTSIGNLHGPEERLPLIWFIIVFPMFIMLVFVYLVVYHHEKLYAPGDFKDEGNFVNILDNKNPNKKRAEENKILKDAQEDSNDTKNQIFIKENGVIEEKVNQPADQRTVEESPLKAEKLDINETELLLRSQNSEYWALQHLELKFRGDIRRNKTLLSGGERLPIDAYIVSGNRALVIEVRYWISTRSIKPLLLNLKNFILKFSRIKRAFPAKEVEIIFVVVFDEIREDKEREIREFIKESDTRISLEVYRYSDLESEFGES